jgi:hypothetical protein
MDRGDESRLPQQIGTPLEVYGARPATLFVAGSLVAHQSFDRLPAPEWRRACAGE